MTAPELIESLFIKENGYQPANIIASDHFAVGCMLIIEGKIDAGLKIVSGAFKLIGGVSDTKQKRIRDYVKKNSAEAFHLVRPHAELSYLVGRPAKSDAVEER
ncbi:MAG: hypothetical protein CVV41_18120 [Candidatus Riflebacteria bacterium HGW-Riflebacteria-1]|jgi:hypothetical protein|nr:MAG: hypothetical protein CVV41_18120 [Candidatus Riflebacteria bacterium HGW-Riflebacteria-1]